MDEITELNNLQSKLAEMKTAYELARRRVITDAINIANGGFIRRGLRYRINHRNKSMQAIIDKVEKIIADGDSQRAALTAGQDCIMELCARARKYMPTTVVAELLGFQNVGEYGGNYIKCYAEKTMRPSQKTVTRITTDGSLERLMHRVEQLENCDIKNLARRRK